MYSKNSIRTNSPWCDLAKTRASEGSFATKKLRFTEFEVDIYIQIQFSPGTAFAALNARGQDLVIDRFAEEVFPLNDELTSIDFSTGARRFCKVSFDCTSPRVLKRSLPRETASPKCSLELQQ